MLITRRSNVDYDIVVDVCWLLPLGGRHFAVKMLIAIPRRCATVALVN